MLSDAGYSTLDCTGFIFYFPNQIDDKFQTLFHEVPAHSPINEFSYFILYLMAIQSLNVEGDFYECGVFRGGSAAFIAKIMQGSGKQLHLFDTFAGMPQTDPERDPVHVKGDFTDTSLEEVQGLVEHEDFVVYHQGRIPETFPQDAKIAFAHIDVDIYQSVKDCLEFIYPRMSKGGVIVLDDYGYYSCKGAREAAEEYMRDKPSVILPMFSNQGLIMKL